MPNSEIILLAALGVCLAVAGVTLIARSPLRALYLTIPVLMWPDIDVPIKFGVLILFILGAGFSSQYRHRLWPLILYLGFTGFMILGWWYHEPGVTVERSAARNSLIAFLLTLCLIPTVAALRPPFQKLLKAMALSGVVIAGYLLFRIDIVEGRAWLVGEYNPNSMGTAAVMTFLCLLALDRLGNRRWLLLAPIPLVLFLLAESRGSLVVLVVGTLLLVTVKLRAQFRLLIALAAFVSLPFVSSITLILQRLILPDRTSSENIETRWEALTLALQVASENLLSGVGWRQFTDVSAKQTGQLLNAHNDYALIAAEAGIFAAILFISLFLPVLTRLRGMAHAGPILRALLIAFMLVLAFGNYAFDPRVVLPLYVVAGVAWSAFTNDASTQTQEVVRATPLAPKKNSMLATRKSARTQAQKPELSV